MSVALITQPAFLRKHFFYTREGLLGQWSRTAERGKTFSSDSSTVVLPEIETILPPPVAEAENFGPLAEPTIAFTPEEIVQVPLVAGMVDVVPEVPPADVVTRVPNERILARAARTRQEPSLIKSAASVVLTAIMVVGLGVGAFLIVPEVYYKVFSQNTAVEEVAGAAKTTLLSQPTATPEPKPYMPAKDLSLPLGTWVKIPKIGVDSEAFTTQDPYESLDKGIWMVPDFGRPGDTTQPVIIAAHRFGWDWWWKSDFGKLHSFYSLTETVPGDRVEIIYDQRKWVYEIYSGEEGKLITDYDADLILYTCKYLNSPIRYFRYAKLVKE